MKDAELVALAEAQWIRSYVPLLMGSGMILCSNDHRSDDCKATC